MVSALALPRIVATLLENHQTTEGIKIPEALRPYTGEPYSCHKSKVASHSKVI